MQKVLVLGGAGYVGSQLVNSLITRGYEVVVYDTFWFGQTQFAGLDHKRLELVKADIRDIDTVREKLSGVTSVIHLACISNDPSFDLNPSLGKSINLDCFYPFVRVLKESGIQRFIYASSSSVYGVREEEKVTEDLPLLPLTDYSRFKAMCEEILLNEVDNEFTFAISRPATVCGFSPRQRLDLVVNILTAHALLNKKIRVFGGEQYRPNLHIEDMVNSYINLLEADANSIHREIFNVGSCNLTVRQIAEAVQEEIDSKIPIVFEETDDLRSYRVDSTKIEMRTGFKARYSVNDAVKDLRDNFYRLDSLQPLLDSRFINIRRMKELNLK